MKTVQKARFHTTGLFGQTKRADGRFHNAAVYTTPSDNTGKEKMMNRAVSLVGIVLGVWMWAVAANAQDTDPPNPFNLVAPANGVWTNATPAFEWDTATDNVGIAKYKLYVDPAGSNCSGAPTVGDISSSATAYLWGEHRIGSKTPATSPRRVWMAYDSTRGSPLGAAVATSTTHGNGTNDMDTAHR